MAPYASTGSHAHGDPAIDEQSRLPYSRQECPPPCPSCGGLECLCRPRFFPGQLLTDEDLNQLDHYVVEKNRLHNRYLHGHGIVCGLDVVCHPCDSKSVIVKPGYALSPCGDDIIVCKDSSVNICDLINRCRPVTQDPCDPMHPGPTDTCPEGPQDWVLAICYDEKPSRGVAALRADTAGACCSQCACGGSRGCGCGCHGSHNGNGHSKATSTTSQNKKRLAQCEPTLTCETYKFMVYRYHDQRSTDVGDKFSSLSMNESYRRTALRWAEMLPSAPQDSASMQVWEAYNRSYQRAAWEFVSEIQCASGDTRGIRDAIEKVPIPLASNFGSNKAEYLKASSEYISRVNVPVATYLSLLLCNVLQLSCPSPVERNCIPLARIRVRKPDCKVLSICGASVREYVLSALLERFYSALRPWLTALLGKLCCKPEPQTPSTGGVVIKKFDDTVRAKAINALRGATGGGGEPQAMNLSSHMEKAFVRTGRPVDVETMVLGLMGATDEQGQLFATPEEIANPAAYLLATQVLRPALKSALPASWDGALEMISRIGAEHLGTMAKAAQPAGLTKEVTALKSTVNTLNKTIASQAAKIATLEKRISDR